MYMPKIDVRTCYGKWNRGYGVEKPKSNNKFPRSLKNGEDSRSDDMLRLYLLCLLCQLCLSCLLYIHMYIHMSVRVTYLCMYMNYADQYCA
jgi:hypothetical protein